MGGMGLGVGGGSWAVIILIVVVLWVLFSKDGHRDGYGGGYGMPYPYPGYGAPQQRCGVCVEDESNWQEDKHLTEKLCMTNQNITQQGCLDREATHCEGEKTRALIEQNYIQDLRDTITEKNAMIQTMKSEAFTTAQIGLVNSKIEKVDEMLERLSCELPKRQPVYAECVTPCTRDLDRDCFREIDRRFDRFEREFPQRGRCDDFCCA